MGPTGTITQREGITRTGTPAAVSWRVFRLVAVGSAVSWLACVAGLAWLVWGGVLPADGTGWAGRMLVVATALFGTSPMANYPGGTAATAAGWSGPPSSPSPPRPRPW